MGKSYYKIRKYKNKVRIRKKVSEKFTKNKK